MGSAVNKHTLDIALGLLGIFLANLAALGRCEKSTTDKRVGLFFFFCGCWGGDGYIVGHTVRYAQHTV